MTRSFFLTAACSALLLCGLLQSPAADARVMMTPPATSPVAIPSTTQKWDIVPSESTITFSGKQMGSEFHGGFQKFSGVIAFDPDNLAASKALITIDTTSVDSKDKERDSNIKSKEWFNIDAFPAATYETTSITKKDGNGYEAVGNLTMIGTTLPVTLPFTLDITKDEKGASKAVMTGTVHIDRSAFKLGTGDWADTSVVANDVTVDVHVVATAQP